MHAIAEKMILQSAEEEAQAEPPRDCALSLCKKTLVCIPCSQSSIPRWLCEEVFNCWLRDWAIKGLVFSAPRYALKQPVCLLTTAMTGRLLALAATQALLAVRHVSA